MDNQPGSFCGRDCFFGPLQQRKPPDGSMSVICLPPEKIGQHVVMGIDRQVSVLATCSLAVVRFGRESVGKRDQQSWSQSSGSYANSFRSTKASREVVLSPALQARICQTTILATGPMTHV
jgi:hypothetical protein